MTPRKSWKVTSNLVNVLKTFSNSFFLRLEIHDVSIRLLFLNFGLNR